MLIAIDPGGTSGVVIRRDDDSLEFYQLSSPGEVYDLLWKETKEHKPTIICENFSTAGRISKDGLHTVRIIGGVQAISKIRELKCYTPEPAQRYMAKVAATELAPKGYNLRHQRDALMHLLAFEYRKSQGGYK